MNNEVSPNFPEKDHLRESPTSSKDPFPHKSTSPPNITTVSFRESSTKASSQPPRKLPNLERRSREFLTDEEVQQLQAAASKIGRHGHRDATMILLAFRHALRVSELIALRWDQIDFKQGLLHVRRRKNGSPSTHPVHGPEIRALRRIARDYAASPYVFVTERNGPLTDSTVRKIVARAGKLARLPFPVHPHMLRHATGFKLANDGQDTRAIQHYLGHKNIAHTVRYTELSAERFKTFWRD